MSLQKLGAVSLETLLGVRLLKCLMFRFYAFDLTWLSGIEGSQKYHDLSDISTLDKLIPILSFFKCSSSFFNRTLFWSCYVPALVKDYMTRAVEVSKDGGLSHNGGFVSCQGQMAQFSTAVVHDASLVDLLAVIEQTRDLAQYRAYERQQLLQIFAMAIPTMLGLSIYFASAISTPISNLAAAMELGADLDGDSLSDFRMKIPDLSD